MTGMIVQDAKFLPLTAGLPTCFFAMKARAFDATAVRAEDLFCL
jgi:hypothetical protein